MENSYHHLKTPSDSNSYHGLPPSKCPPTNFNSGEANNLERPICKLKPNPRCYFLEGKVTEALGRILKLFLIIPILFTVIELLRLKNTTYYFSSKRIKIDSGLFDLTEEWIQLFRVKDVRKKQGFLYRFFKLADIEVYSTNTRKPVYIFKGLALYDANKLVPILQYYVHIEHNSNRPDIGTVPWNHY